MTTRREILDTLERYYKELASPPPAAASKLLHEVNELLTVYRSANEHGNDVDVHETDAELLRRFDTLRVQYAGYAMQRKTPVPPGRK